MCYSSVKYAFSCCLKKKKDSCFSGICSSLFPLTLFVFLGSHNTVYKMQTGNWLMNREKNKRINFSLTKENLNFEIWSLFRFREFRTLLFTPIPKCRYIPGWNRTMAKMRTKRTYNTTNYNVCLGSFVSFYLWNHKCYVKYDI